VAPRCGWPARAATCRWPPRRRLCAPLLTVQSFYRAINALALRRGFNPDLPPHLNKVTETV
jgi:glucosamine--fructose-6-phosphate aminotransferase (isomerizing)